MSSENQSIYKCNVCEQSFDTARALAIHTSAKYTHDGLQLNKLNEIVFICNHCNKTFRSQKIVIIIDVMQNIRLTVWLLLEKQWKQHPKKHKTSTQERVIELSISMALGRVHLKLPMS